MGAGSRALPRAVAKICYIRFRLSNFGEIKLTILDKITAYERCNFQLPNGLTIQRIVTIRLALDVRAFFVSRQFNRMMYII